MKKIPKIDLFYWALIISANTMGETAGDLISQTFNLGYGGGTIVLIALFVVALLVSIVSKTQHLLVYWTVITLASTAGTTISDYVTRTLDLGYMGGTLALAISLVFIFGIWHLVSKTDALKGGLSRTTEFLYWIAILTSSTLGTALGDLLAHDTPLGFGGGTLLLLGLLLLVVFLTLFTKISRELCYWLAIILTHPIGATMGDYLTKPEGFNLGNINASLLLVGVFAIVILAANLAHNKP